jgi:hypothetical protein
MSWVKQAKNLTFAGQASEAGHKRDMRSLKFQSQLSDVSVGYYPRSGKAGHSGQ